LFALDPEFLAKPDGGSSPVEVPQAEVQPTFPTSARLQMEPHEQQVEVRILTCGPDRVDDLAQLVVFEGATTIGEAARLLQLSGRAPGDEACPLGAGEESAQCPDAVLAGRTSVGPGSVALSPGHRVGHDRLAFVDADIVDQALTKAVEGETPIRLVRGGSPL